MTEGRKRRKSPLSESDVRHSSHSSHRPDSSSHRPQGSSSQHSASSRSYWNTVMHPSNPPPQRDRTNPAASSHAYPVPPISDHSSSQSQGGSSQTSRSTPRPAPITIAPRGPIQPRDDDDGYRFECQEEGCHQKFRHRSSRSRHRRQCHSQGIVRSSGTNR